MISSALVSSGTRSSEASATEAPDDNHEREFPFSDKEFNTLTKMVYERTGIVLKDNKKNMVYGRLARRLRKLGMYSFKEYLAYLDSADSADETGMLINAITTNLTKNHLDKMNKSLHINF